MTNVVYRSPGEVRVVAPWIFHLDRRAIASSVFDLKRDTIGQALTPRIFHLNLNTIEQAAAPRVIRLNRRNPAPRVFHLNHAVPG
jgi:hypothetical protein